MRLLGSIALAQDTPLPIEIDSNATGLILANESLYSLQVNIGAISTWLPAWTVDFYDFSKTPIGNGQASIIPRYYTSVTNPPSALALPTVVYPGDTVTGTFPYSLNRQVSSNVVASSSYALLAPDNLAEFFADDTSFANILALLPAQVPPNGNLLDILLAAKLNGSTDKVVLQSDVANNNVNLSMALGFEINIAAGINQWIKGFQIVSGTGSGTFSHLLGVTPIYIGLSPTQAAEAWFVGSYTPTQFTVGGITGTHAWKALLIA